MKVVYDNIVYSLQNFGGISTYWYELTRRMMLEADVDITFAETKNVHNNMLRRELDILKEQSKLFNRGNLFIERFLKVPTQENTDIFHSSYFRIPKNKPNNGTVTTIHDFTHDLFYSGPRVWLHNLNKKEAIEKSDVIIAVSNHTKKDLIKFYPKLNEAKIKVVYNGVSDKFCVLPKQNLQNVKPYFLFIGSREHYKNFDFAISLVEQFKDFDLHIVGSVLNKGESDKIYKSLGQRHRVSTGISPEELNVLYNQAFCLLYPSSYEGFGIPLLEAMKAGCPFIALNASSIPEVAGHAGVLINELKLEEGLAAIRTILCNRTEIVEKGFQQAMKFSWDACFRQTHDIYKGLA